MLFSPRSLCVFVSTCIVLPNALAVPAPQRHVEPNIGSEGPVGGVDVNALPTATATGSSGSLRGGSNLLGEVAPASAVSGGNSAQVTNYELVNGQDADPKLGLYLDFAGTENPQPLRGNTGQTDPGPR